MMSRLLLLALSHHKEDKVNHFPMRLSRPLPARAVTAEFLSTVLKKSPVKRVAGLGALLHQQAGKASRMLLRPVLR
jgi:hypothetical protein